MQHDAIFVLSTGRCGTQWLHDAMQTCYGDLVEASHEPLKAGYQPRRFFRSSRAGLTALGDVPEVAAHVARIRAQLERGPYFEAGWPCFAALPWLHEALDGRLRIVHLARHPVTTAFSMATHQVYDRDDWIRDAALTPFDGGCLRPALQLRWAAMSGYEKCLFWWTELHRYAIDLHRRRPDIAWHATTYEALFAPTPDALHALVDFCGLPRRPALGALRERRTDQYHYRTWPDDWRKALQSPETVEVAEALGYDIADTDAHALSARYFRRKKLRHYLADWTAIGRRFAG
ncbi:MAG: sulfotransferase domain-containing protein [Xanthomonadales bacterium]|nr:sulfotransferase domain-containing protein [Xanthomonadales bacterium]